MSLQQLQIVHSDTNHTQTVYTELTEVVNQNVCGHTVKRFELYVCVNGALDNRWEKCG